jgi:hypothetical protein
MKHFRLSVVAFLIWTAAWEGAAMAQMRHPGIFSSQADLDFIKATVATNPAHPMTRAFAALRTSRFGVLTYQPRPLPIITTQANVTTADESELRAAPKAAYAHALQWVVTGLPVHRDKALQVLDSWAMTLQNIQASDGADDQPALEAAWATPIWINAAEIMRYYNNGEAMWPEASIQQFDVMVDLLMKFVNTTLAQNRTNNWGTSGALSIMAAGAYQNKQELFDAGVQYWRKLLPVNVFATGELGETCRDCVHAQYGIVGLIQGAEVAYHQGVDLYGTVLTGDDGPRLVKGLEYMTQSLLGVAQPATCGAPSCAGNGNDHYAGWEMGFNHYVNRMKMMLPHTQDFVTMRNRIAGSGDHFLGWTTVTHADLDLGGAPIVTDAGRPPGATPQPAGSSPSGGTTGTGGRTGAGGTAGSSGTPSGGASPPMAGAVRGGCGCELGSRGERQSLFAPLSLALGLTWFLGKRRLSARARALAAARRSGPGPAAPARAR